jgi:hypothetical protein
MSLPEYPWCQIIHLNLSHRPIAQVLMRADSWQQAIKFPWKILSTVLLTSYEV